MAASLLEGKRHAAALFPHASFTDDADEDKMSLAFAYLRLEQWKKALDIFQTYSNRPVQIGNEGPWGDAYTVIFTGRRVDFCRRKLGQRVEANPLEFDMGKSVLCMCTLSTFTADESGLWVGIDGQLIHLDFELKTNLVVRLPLESQTPITDISLNSSVVIAATAGGGLIEYDKGSGTCRRFTVNDGLTMNFISHLSLAGDVLWIGYGQQEGGIRMDTPGGGGLGSMDLSSHKFTSFTPSIAAGRETRGYQGGNTVAESSDQPPRRAIRSLTASADGDVWFTVTGQPVRHYRIKGNVWEGTQMHASTGMALGSDRLFVSQSSPFASANNLDGPLGVDIMDIKTSGWHSLKAADGLPCGEVRTLTLDGNNLWLGGLGYVAVVDLTQEKVKRFAYIKANEVDRIRVGGGYVWAQFDWHLYRASLSGM
jgi:hypothetical protein